MAAFATFHAPGFWLVVSLLCLLAVAAAQSLLPRTWRTVALLATWLGVPYLALISGGVSPRLLGLRYLDWAATFRLGAGVLLTVVTLAVVVRLVVTSSTARGEVSPRPGAWLALLRTIGWSGAEELNWCFWRGAVWEVLLIAGAPTGLPAYWAIWLAALVNLPFAIVFQPTAWQRIVAVVTLAVTSVVFFYTGNFWLCWLIHAVLWVVVAPAMPVEIHARPGAAHFDREPATKHQVSH